MAFCGIFKIGFGNEMCKGVILWQLRSKPMRL